MEVRALPWGVISRGPRAHHAAGAMQVLAVPRWHAVKFRLSKDQDDGVPLCIGAGVLCDTMEAVPGSRV